MGQYYRNSILSKNYKNVKQPVVATLCPYEYDNGAKLMEFSYVHNGLMKPIEWLLANDFYGYPFVTAGDYSDNIFTKKYQDMTIFVTNKEYFMEENDECSINKIKEVIGEGNYTTLMTVGECPMDYDECIANFIEDVSGLRVKSGINIYEAASNFEDTKKYKTIKATIPAYDDIPDYKYIINFDKKEYTVMPKYEPKKWNINSLSLLCAFGNGLGGGDYHGTDMDFVGRWAFDRIGLTNDKNAIKGFTKITPKFKESWG